MNINNRGILYIVATPIGNLKDMGARAIEVLKNVSQIAAEDTRHSLFLCQHYGITTPTISLHEHNEKDKAAILLKQLLAGQSIALISDAGTPLINDPGYYLVREARSQGISVVPIPGPCAAIAALSVAGLPTDRFVFEGFLPAKSKARLDRLLGLSAESRTMIFYEAPHRIVDLLEAMQNAWGGDRQAVIARELTKMFETIHSDTIEKLIAWVKEDSNQQRGEIVVLVAGSMDSTPESSISSKKILTLLLQKVTLKEAVEITAEITGERKNDLYTLALDIKKS